MKITILTVGKLGRMVEAQLALDYASRATASGRALALGPVEIVEVEARKPGRRPRPRCCVRTSRAPTSSPATSTAR